MSDEKKRSVNDYLTGQFDRQIANVAADLRALADRVEGRGKVSTHVDRPYVFAAGAVVSAVMNALPNLNLSGLIAAAHDCETLMEPAAVQS